MKEVINNLVRLALRSDLSKSAFCPFHKNTQPISQELRLAKALDVEKDWLFPKKMMNKQDLAIKKQEVRESKT